MKIKKLFISSMLTVMSIFTVFGMASCGSSHEHSFSDWETVAEPTCTAFGLRKRACDCGFVDYGTTDALSHTPVIDAAVDATCTTAGKTEGSHCADCGAVIVAQTETEKLSHSFSDWEIVAEPTCTAFGLRKRACDCGFVDYGTTDALSHTPVIDAAVDATCTTLGKTEGSHCADCGAVIVAQTEMEKLSHSFSDWEIVAEPTCTAFGLRKRACDCGFVDYGTTDALSHTPVIDAAVDATCTTVGKTEGSHCKDCGAVIVAQNTIGAFGHNCDQITIVEEALCNLEGKKRFACSNAGCAYYYEENYALAELSRDEIYAAAVQYTGVIQVFDRFGNLMSEASAFVISADGKIVTNNLLIDNAFAAVFWIDGEYYDVTEILAYSTVSNIAVLKMDVTDFPCAKLCMRDPVEAETVYIVGAPSGFVNSMSSGVISKANREEMDANYIQHDAEMSSGYLGGPLINRFGEVIGVNIGFIGDDRLNIAAWISELEALDYSNPISMEEYGNITHAPAEQLNYWVLNNYNATQGNNMAYVVKGKDFYYSLGYDTVAKYSFAEGYWVKDGQYQLYVRIIFDKAEGTYQYYATLTDGVRQNEVNGFLDAATYTQSTILTYDTFYGRYWTESELMSLYSTSVYDTLRWFSYCLDTYFDTLTLETFGFSELSYDRDEDALDKLNGFVAENGTLNPENGSYVIFTSKQVNDDTVILEIAYTPEIEECPTSTVVTVQYYTAGGELYVVSLILNPMEDGNRFDVLYAIYNGTEFITQNSGWGYLDANSLTNETKLTCYEFFGMNEYEDALLTDYASLLSYVMGLMNELLPEIDPALTIKDFGFLFYFG